MVPRGLFNSPDAHPLTVILSSMSVLNMTAPAMSLKNAVRNGTLDAAEGDDFDHDFEVIDAFARVDIVVLSPIAVATSKDNAVRNGITDKNDLLHAAEKNAIEFFAVYSIRVGWFHPYLELVSMPCNPAIQSVILQKVYKEYGLSASHTVQTLVSISAATVSSCSSARGAPIPFTSDVVSFDV